MLAPLRLKKQITILITLFIIFITLNVFAISINNPILTEDCTVYTVAGDGKRGHAGDGGAAIDARLNGPTDVAFGKDGSIIILDSHVIRRIATNGIIQTIAGGGNKKATDTLLLPTEVKFSELRSLAITVDDDLYFIENVAERLHLISNENDLFSNIIISSGGFSKYYTDSNVDGLILSDLRYGGDDFKDVHVGLDGWIYLIINKNFDRNRIIRFDPKTLKIQVVAGVFGYNNEGFAGDGRLATQAQLNNPSSVAVDIKGNVFIADNGNERIRKISFDGRINTIFSNVNVDSLAVDVAGNLYFKESGEIWKLATDSKIYQIAGGGKISPLNSDGLPATSITGFSGALNIDPEGNIFVANGNHKMLHRIECESQMAGVSNGGDSESKATDSADESIDTGDGSENENTLGNESAFTIAGGRCSLAPLSTKPNNFIWFLGFLVLLVIRLKLIG